MNSERRVAIALATLCIVATVAGLLASAAFWSLSRGPNVLSDLPAHDGAVMTAAFFQLAMAVAAAGVAFMIYLTLKQDADPNSTGSSLLYAPLGPQETILAVWPIAWEFRLPVAAAGA